MKQHVGEYFLAAQLHIFQAWEWLPLGTQSKLSAKATSRAVKTISRHNTQLQIIRITNIFAADNTKYQRATMPPALEPYEMLLSWDNDQPVSPAPCHGDPSSPGPPEVH